MDEEMCVCQMERVRERESPYHNFEVPLWALRYNNQLIPVIEK